MASSMASGRVAVAVVGTYTQELPHVRGRGEGVYAVSVDPASGSLAPLGLVGGTRPGDPADPADPAAPSGPRRPCGNNPSYVAPPPEGSPPGSFLACFEECGPDPADGSVALLRLELGDDSGNGAVGSPSAVLVASAGAGGLATCHVAGLTLPGGVPGALAANYAGGSVAAVVLQADGPPRGPRVVRLPGDAGSGAVPDRQEAPHAHHAAVVCGGTRALVADLGNDRVAQFVIGAGGALEPNPAGAAAAFPPGSGPRHLAVSPCGRAAYVVCELSNTLVSCALSGDGVLRVVGGVSTLPAGYAGPASWAAAVRVSACGRHVWVTNRGADSIATFAVAAGSPERLDDARPPAFSDAGGKSPRDICVTPCGRWMLAACQDSHRVSVFAIDAENGSLSPRGGVDVPSPVSVCFVRL